eukprot:jgi/Botrbrau1/22043/Bobra.0024s0055.1
MASGLRKSGNRGRPSRSPDNKSPAGKRAPPDRGARLTKEEPSRTAWSRLSQEWKYPRGSNPPACGGNGGPASTSGSIPLGLSMGPFTPRFSHPANPSAAHHAPLQPSNHAGVRPPIETHNCDSGPLDMRGRLWHRLGGLAQTRCWGRMRRGICPREWQRVTFCTPVPFWGPA